MRLAIAEARRALEHDDVPVGAVVAGPGGEVIAAGHNERELLRAAREGDHDVILVGSRGRGRVTAALLGSVSNRLMHDAPVPVIIVHAPRGEDDPDLAA